MRVIAAVFALTFFLVACADDQQAPAHKSAEYKAGTHYVVLDNPVRTADSNKIEVTEIFWYGCGHCFRFDPVLHQWAEKLPADVDFKLSPAMWGGNMELHARAFYTAKALNMLDKLHQPLFNALNLENKPLASEAELASFFAQHGVDKATFTKTFNSFGVVSQVKQADARARSYQIGGTPEMVVEGKYRVSGGMAGGQQKMLDVVDFLIAKTRAERD
jgi:thiol:disulfide interchange protein DsbA